MFPHSEEKVYSMKRINLKTLARGTAVVGDEALHPAKTGGLSKAYITKCEVFPYLDPD